MSKYNTISNFLFNNTTPVLLPVVCAQAMLLLATLVLRKWMQSPVQLHPII
jgi:hypothetical protein